MTYLMRGRAKGMSQARPYLRTGAPTQNERRLLCSFIGRPHSRGHQILQKTDQWFGLLESMGCIVCLNKRGVKSPADIHHIHKNGRRVDDLHTIPLCYWHHRAGVNGDEYVSRHPWKKAFEKRYGSEWELYEQVKQNAEILLQMQQGTQRGRHGSEVQQVGEESGD